MACTRRVIGKSLTGQEIRGQEIFLNQDISSRPKCLYDPKTPSDETTWGFYPVPPPLRSRLHRGASLAIVCSSRNLEHAALLSPRRLKSEGLYLLSGSFPQTELLLHKELASQELSPKNLLDKLIAAPGSGPNGNPYSGKVVRNR